MYELSRVRLYSIGPAGARYADTVLDLRGVGEPVPDPAPTQAEFFEEEPSGPPRRPAPAGVLFLENGGGKSVLLKLIFSVMLPGHRNTLGGASSGVLRKFLLADDCGHVALEWQHVQTGECVVVGKVSEWRGRQVSNDPRKFAEAWYSFRPGPGLSLDGLPVAESTAVRPSAEGTSGAQGRRRTMKGFRDALTEAGKAYPHLEVHWEEIHDRWIEHLGDLGLDPELFRYQREMNADEGEAAGLFAVKKDSDFTDLLLRAVTDTRDTDGLADLVSGFGNKLGRRAELIAERDFTAGSVDLLGRIVEAADARSRARDVHGGAERRTRTLARRLSARAVRERVRAADLAQRVTAAAYAVTHSEGARERSALIAAELAYRHASLALAAAEKSAAAQKRELADARTLHSAWQAAEAVLRHRAAADRVARVSAAIQEAERDAAPALAARAKAAVDLVRALHTAAGSAEALANEEEERSAALQEVSDCAYRDSTTAATEAQRARSEAGHLRQRLTEVEQETAEAVRAGWLDDSAPDADPARAALAASDAEKTAVTAWDAAREAARKVTEHAREAAAAESRAELTAARAADAATATERAYEAERRLAESLAAEERLAELLSLPGAPAAAHAGVPGPRSGADDTMGAAGGPTEAGPGRQADGSAGGRAGEPTGPGADGTPGAEGPLAPEELDRFADELRALLDDAVSTAERHLFDLRTAAADDSRILGALGDGGLLPPGPDVLATVEFLGEHGIPALPGWRYLAQAVDPADHARVLAARPELVDGVIITDPDTHARARDALADAALLPRSAVAVGTAAALLAPTPAADATPGDVFLVPPNPAMHDEHAADEERQALRARATARDEEIRALAARLGKDRELAARLASWRTGCPAGRLTELARTAQEARAFAEEAEAELAEARTLRAEADEVAAEAVQVRDERQEAAQRARRAADALAGLAYRLRERAGWQARLRELADEAAESEARAQACLERARAADEDRRAAQRAADDTRRTARALRAERSEIAGAPDDVPEEDTDAPTASLPALREAYRAASQVYEKVGVGADLRAEQARAESDESAARAELDRLSNKVRTRAEQLLQSPDGSDGPSRQAAAARAEELVQLLETRMSSASEQLGRLRGEAERHAPEDGEAHTELPEELVPRDAEHAQALLRTATGELAARTGALAEAREAHAELLEAHRAAEDAAGGFDEIAAMLRDLLREHSAEEEQEEPEPYPGSLEEARQSAAEARRSLRGCAADLSAAEAAVREASDVLVRHANSTRYEQVRTPARQQIRELPASALPEHAQKWADAFAPRLRVLTDELAQLERNRDSIVDRLRGLVESALATLRSAQRLSRLPEGLGEWSGQEFLRIRFEEPDQATLTERLGEVIDEATRAAVKKNSDLRRDGVSLLLRGVAAALQPKGVAVEILKPDAVLRAERVPVGQMGDVFSGGQLLTAAIALYCTMAALRSNDRGRDKHRHAGTLFLDNPIGRANATYLLELQRAVSDALGVQLLYTTGLFDTTALAEFPLVIRLRNDADLRAGLKYISVEEHLRPGLPQQPQAGEAGHSEITATRMYKKPAPSAP
ncbi:collagen-like triple helix repeat-containing protein [Streptomyces durhamensis]|uniref:collagen-like triple helix repeat-containing protein n=1 Tax=Streptomyces durhamensis TaxID=68194 RepID=UPI0004CD305E|nr:collagen-like protein [Streptomyces durhamensis]